VSASERLEFRTAIVGQAQRLGQPTSSVAIDRTAQPAFDIADGACADARLLGQLFLGKASCRAVPPQLGR
jgi:hypothetical protein